MAAKNEHQALLTRLRRDTRGNTLAMMAIALIPVSALAGSAVDMARLYVVKARLQQACDAGVLAGRKFLLDSNSSTLDTNAATQARTFFANNFTTGWMRTNAVSFTPAKTVDNQVSGVASANVPMTIMKMFKSPDVALSVSCEARFDVADADIMMVLDTTGSMACAANESSCSQPTETYTRADGTTGYAVQEKTTSKIRALRDAVLDFYDTLDQNVDPSTHIRYGFVPYTSSANVGYLLPNDYLVKQWRYQSRRIVGDANYGAATDETSTGLTSALCTRKAGRTPASGFDTSGNATVRTVKSFSGTTCVISAQPVVPNWRYDQWTSDVSQYTLGNAVADPSKYTGATNKWQGCIEERNTTTDTSFDPNNLPPDLDPDLIPKNDGTRWRPMWPEQIYDRSGTENYTIADFYLSPKAPGNGQPNYSGYFPNIGGDPAYLRNGFSSCGKSAQRLAEMTRTQVSNYVNTDFRSLGGTYHDVGMIWGTRLLSPSGPFKNDTAAWPGRSTPNRHIVFMTDGDMAPNEIIYGQYGMERYDKRIAGGDTATLTERHNARFVAVCEAARARNIQVWVIAFGSSLNDQLKGCATPPWNQHAFFASNDDELTKAFKTIAKQVAMLRVSK